IVVENYLKQWLGTMPMDAMRLLDRVAGKDTLSPWQLSNVPFVGAFIMREPQAGPVLENFYVNLRKLTEVNADLRVAIERGDMGEIRSSTRARGLIRLDAFSRAIQQQTNVINAIYRDSSLTNDEKRKHIDGIYSGIVQLARAGLEAMHA